MLRANISIQVIAHKWIADILATTLQVSEGDRISALGFALGRYSVAFQNLKGYDKYLLSIYAQ